MPIGQNMSVGQGFDVDQLLPARDMVRCELERKAAEAGAELARGGFG